MSLEGVRILLVTRDRAVHDTVRTLCSQIAPTFRGLEWAGSYRAALMALEAGAVDACILDVALVNGMGLDLLDEPSLRAGHVPVILLLDAPPLPDEDPLARPGVADWIVEDELDATSLQRALRHAAMGRDAAMARSRERRAREELLPRLSEALSRARVLEEALHAAVEAVVRHLGWEVGHVYLPDDGGLSPSRIWVPDDPERHAALRRATEGTWIAPGQGMVGEALADRRPVWRSDVTADPTFARKGAGLGVRSALAVPVVADGEVAAVLEFFSPEVRAPDPEVLDTAGRVSALLAPIASRQRVLDSLRGSHDLLSAMVEGIPDALFVKDTEGRYLTVNGAAAAEAGRPVMEVLGRSDTELFEPETAAALRRQDRQVIESGRRVTLEEVLESPAGIRKAYRITKGPLRDRGGRIVGVYGIARDVTEPKRLERELRAEKEELGVEKEELRTEKEELRAENEELEDRVRVLETLLGVETTLRAPGLALEERLERVAGIVCGEGVLAGDPTEARIVLHGKEFRTPDFDPSAEARRVPIRSGTGEVGFLEVMVSGEGAEPGGGRTAELLDRIARELASFPARPDDTTN